ncbi:MAG: 50S ribosomal protein L6 [Patescibacteria group bacterium]|nr:50S ribosomal protein L6 [Patescibacteria group bacterium]
MSKIGKKPIIIPEGITVEKKDGVLEIKKENQILIVNALPYIVIEFTAIKEDDKSKNAVVFKPNSNLKQATANWGTIRALTQNAIDGLTKGFIKKLEIEGIGYRANIEGENLILNIGYSHPVKYIPKKGIKISIEKNVIIISGNEKALVGQTAAEIRAIKKPEPYKGKGIRYQGEIIKKKAGKKAGTAIK